MPRKSPSRFGVSSGKEAPEILRKDASDQEIGRATLDTQEALQEEQLPEFDEIPEVLDPSTFPAGLTRELLGDSQVKLRKAIPVVMDLLQKAAKQAEAGDAVTYSASQWQLLLDTFGELGGRLGVLTEGAFSLEWSMALHTLLLNQALRSCPPDAVAKIKNMRETMYDMMQAFVDKEFRDGE